MATNGSQSVSARDYHAPMRGSHEGEERGSTDEKLATLIEKARNVRMSPQDWEEQRRSFAYGNTKIENDRITRQMIDEEAEALKRTKP